MTTPVAVADIGKQLPLCLAVRFPQLQFGNVAGPDEQLRFIRPAGNVLVEQLRHFLAGPGEGVYAVRDGMDVVAGEHVLRYLTVFLRHAVDVLAQVERQHRHVQVVLARKVLEHVEGNDLAEHLLDEGIGELVMARLDRRVGREHAEVPHPGDVPDRPLVPHALDVALEPEQQFEGEKTRMSLVHVIFLDMEFERLEHAHAAHAEHDLLLDPVGAVAAVEIIGDAPVLGLFSGRSVSRKRIGTLPPVGLMTMIDPGLDSRRRGPRSGP